MLVMQAKLPQYLHWPALFFNVFLAFFLFFCLCVSHMGLHHCLFSFSARSLCCPVQDFSPEGLVGGKKRRTKPSTSANVILLHCAHSESALQRCSSDTVFFFLLERGLTHSIIYIIFDVRFIRLFSPQQQTNNEKEGMLKRYFILYLSNSSRSFFVLLWLFFIRLLVVVSLRLSKHLVFCLYITE